MDLQVRNSRFVSETLIDCEINHPIYGWIPFTASKNDAESHGREIFELLKNDPLTLPLK